MLKNASYGSSMIVYLDTYTKTPHEWLTAFEEAPELRQYRDALKGTLEKGYICTESGAKFFVQLDQLQFIKDALIGKKIGYMHVVVLEESKPLVAEVVKRMRSRARPKIKDSRELRVPASTIHTPDASEVPMPRFF